MTIKLSTGLRTKMLDGGAAGGMKGALNGGFINIYSGPQPLSADTGATGTLLATVSVAGACRAPIASCSMPATSPTGPKT